MLKNNVFILSKKLFQSVKVENKLKISNWLSYYMLRNLENEWVLIIKNKHFHISLKGILDHLNALLQTFSLRNQRLGHLNE